MQYTAAELIVFCDLHRTLLWKSYNVIRKALWIKTEIQEGGVCSGMREIAH